MIKNFSKINLMNLLKRSKGSCGIGDPTVPFQLKKVIVLKFKSFFKENPENLPEHSSFLSVEKRYVSSVAEICEFIN